MTLHVLQANDLDFPDPNSALTDPNGLLAVGGDLSPPRLIRAYQQGIFPWYSDGEPIMWWSPDPRAVIFFDNLKISRRLKTSINNCPFKVTFNKAFDLVVKGCALPRPTQSETWISEEMNSAYNALHRLQHAMSVEVWLDDQLVGGIYGVLVNQVFSGESMFSLRPNASKIALISLVEHLKNNGFKLIDCQVMTPHLKTLGATEIPRDHYLKLLNPPKNNCA